MTMARCCRILALTALIAYPLTVAGVAALLIFGPWPEDGW